MPTNFKEKWEGVPLLLRALGRQDLLISACCEQQLQKGRISKLKIFPDPKQNQKKVKLGSTLSAPARLLSVPRQQSSLPTRPRSQKSFLTSLPDGAGPAGLQVTSSHVPHEGPGQALTSMFQGQLWTAFPSRAAVLNLPSAVAL